MEIDQSLYLLNISSKFFKIIFLTKEERKINRQKDGGGGCKRDAQNN
jgi:hypothetical protein